MQTKLVLKQPSALKLRFQPGATGPSGTLSVGSTTTGAPGSSASVVNSGTSTAAVFDFTIPRGNTGTAATVAAGSTTTGSAGSNASVVNSGTSAAAVFDFTVPRGDTGSAATVAAGTTTTGAAGTSASVTNSGTSSAAVFNFTIPRGADGVTDGDKGGVVVTSTGTVWTVKLSALAAVVGDSGSGGVKGLVPAPAAGDAAAGKMLAADGTWKTPGQILLGTYGPSGGTIIVPLPAAYTHLQIQGHRLEPTNAGEFLQMQIATDGVPNFLTAANYRYDGQQTREATATADWQSTTDTRFSLSAVLNAAGTNAADLTMNIRNGPAALPEIDWIMPFRRQTTNEKSTVRGSGYYSGSSSRWTHLRFSFNTGSVSSNASIKLLAYS